MLDTGSAPLGALKNIHTIHQWRLVDAFVTLLVGDSFTSELCQEVNCVGAGVRDLGCEIGWST